MTRGQVLAIRAEPQPIRLVYVLSASVPAGRRTLRLDEPGVVRPAGTRMTG